MNDRQRSNRYWRTAYNENTHSYFCRLPVKTNLENATSYIVLKCEFMTEVGGEADKRGSDK